MQVEKPDVLVNAVVRSATACVLSKYTARSAKGRVFSKNQMLHADTLKFLHPYSGDSLVVRSEAPF